MKYHHVRLLGLTVMLVGFVGGPILVWQGLHEQELNRAVKHAKLCPLGVHRSSCIGRVSAITIAVIQPDPNPVLPGDFQKPGAGNVEPRILLRLKDGKRIALDAGFKNLPAVGQEVTAYYYEGQLLRANRSDGKLIVTTWTPAYWWLHALTGVGLIGLAIIAVVHRLHSSRERLT